MARCYSDQGLGFKKKQGRLSLTFLYLREAEIAELPPQISFSLWLKLFFSKIFCGGFICGGDQSGTKLPHAGKNEIDVLGRKALGDFGGRALSIDVENQLPAARSSGSGRSGG